MDKRLEILKVMNSITNNMDFKEFTLNIGLSQEQALRYMQELAETGFLKKVGKGYAMAQKGKVALRMLKTVPEGSEFHFYTGINQYTGFSAKSIEDFNKIIRNVDTAALEFHVFRGDFENWIETVFKDSELAEKLKNIRESGMKGEALRKEVLEVTEPRYQTFKKHFMPSHTTS
ncbi:hypothetical protein GTO27_09165 [Candidatus Bathyarchaeota archaeon]|nr:hypothetical protein [Candidatus Bathyarchaeota archaeon]